MFEKLLKRWAEDQGFQGWSQDHAAVLRNLAKWANEDVYIGQLTWEEGDALAKYISKWYAAQQSVQLTALRRWLALSIFINVVLLAVVLFTIGGN